MDITRVRCNFCSNSLSSNFHCSCPPSSNTLSRDTPNPPPPSKEKKRLHISPPFWIHLVHTLDTFQKFIWLPLPVKHSPPRISLSSLFAPWSLFSSPCFCWEPVYSWPRSGTDPCWGLYANRPSFDLTSDVWLIGDPLKLCVHQSETFLNELFHVRRLTTSLSGVHCNTQLKHLS